MHLLLCVYSLFTDTGAVKDKLKWADGKLVKTTIEEQVLYPIHTCITVIW